jgi:hypothetical protein
VTWLLHADVLSQPAKRRGDPRVIAATGRRHGLTIVTGNARDCRRPGVKVFDPFEELP